MPLIKLLTFFFSLQLTFYSVTLASTIINFAPSEQDIAHDFYIGNAPGVKNESNSLRFGYFSEEKWANVSLVNKSSTPVNRLLYFDTLTGLISLYEKTAPDASLIYLSSSGSSIPYNLREFKSIFATFKISIPAHSEKNYFFKIVSRHNFNSKVFIGNADTLKKRELNKLSFLDFYAGGILSLIFYNLFLFSFLKDKHYLYYCNFSLAFFLAILDLHGLLDKIFANSFISFSHHLICFSSYALLTATVFTYHFLEMPKFLPKRAKAYQILIALCLGLILIGMTPLEDLAPAFFGGMIDLLLVIANLSFIVCSVLLWKSNSTARFYLFSWAVVGFSLLAWFGMTFGYLPNNFFTQHLLLYANLGQMLVLSLALAYRIHKLTEEKLAAEEKALQKEKYQRLVRVLSHDIANSLTIINSYSKKLIKPKNLEAPLQKTMEKIYFAAENIKNILRNVREEDLLSLRKKELELHPTNVLLAINNASVVFEEHLRYKNLKLVINVPVDLFIMANSTCFLNNIVINILSNCIKFSFDHSTIEIEALRTPEQTTLSFRDFGLGIETNLINDIFFSNNISSSLGTNAETGHGFGTKLMREYLELFGGRLLVESTLHRPGNENCGTCVTLVFPLVAN